MERLNKSHSFSLRLENVQMSFHEYIKYTFVGLLVRAESEAESGSVGERQKRVSNNR